MHPWIGHKVVSGEDLVLQIGPLTLVLAQRGLDWLLAEQRSSEAEERTDREINWDSGYQRFAFHEAVSHFILKPRFPNRPVVVRPLHSMKVAPDASVSFFISLPVEVQLLARTTSGKQINLARIPSEILSDTWFGPTTEGSLAYSLKSRARRSQDEITSNPSNRLICPITISNKAVEPLPCQKFCLHFQYSRIWITDNGRMWGSHTALHFLGKDELSETEHSSNPPPAAKGAQLIMEADQKAPRNLIQKTFGFI